MTRGEDWQGEAYYEPQCTRRLKSGKKARPRWTLDNPWAGTPPYSSYSGTKTWSDDSTRRDTRVPTPVFSSGSSHR